MRTDKKDSDFPKRLRAKMESQGVSKKKLHKMTGISYEMVRRYVNSEATPREEKILLIAEALSTTASYLSYGVEVHELSKSSEVGFDSGTQPSCTTNKNNTDSIVRNVEDLHYVPVLNFSQAEHLHRTKRIALADSFEPVVGSFYGNNTYWIIIEDDSMKPYFKRRDLVLIDSNLEPSPSDFVLACMNDDKGLLLRRWRPRGFNEMTGKPYEQLVAEHEDYPLIDSRHMEFEVCGVAIEYKRRLK